MKAHVLDDNGLIINTIIVSDLDSMSDLDLIDAEIGGGIGWSYINGVLTPPVEG